MDISSISLSLSAISLGLSLYVIRRDKGVSATASACMDGNELIGYKIGVYIVNLGRKPVTLRGIVVENYDGEVFRHRLKDVKDDNIKLSQSEFYEFILAQDNSEITQWAKSKIKSVKVVDSSGDAWEVKDFANTINNYHHSEKLPSLSPVS
jgi:hypothetical protein